MKFRAIFGVLGNITDLIKFWLPAGPTHVVSAARTQAGIVMSALWVMYGLGAGDVFLMTTNTVSFCLQYVFLVVFSKRRFTINSGLVLIELACVYYFANWPLLDCDDPIKVLGAVCATGSILISAVEMLFETRPSDVQIFACGATGFIWTIYGLVSADIVILVPNLVQLVQFAIRYRAHVKRPLQSTLAVVFDDLRPLWQLFAFHYRAHRLYCLICSVSILSHFIAKWFR